jgi:hypothetical protein
MQNVTLAFTPRDSSSTRSLKHKPPDGARPSDFCDRSSPHAQRESAERSSMSSVRTRSSGKLDTFFALKSSLAKSTLRMRRSVIGSLPVSVVDTARPPPPRVISSALGRAEKHRRRRGSQFLGEFSPHRCTAACAFFLRFKVWASRLQFGIETMPRPRKPTSLHLVTGTFNSTRHADRHEPQVTAPLGDAPSDWPPQAKAIWQEVVNAIPDGVAGRPDRIIVELTARLLIETRSKGKFTAAVAAQLRCCLASLGLTPADRSRVSASLADLVTTDADRFFSC